MAWRGITSILTKQKVQVQDPKTKEKKTAIVEAILKIEKQKDPLQPMWTKNHPFDHEWDGSVSKAWLALQKENKTIADLVRDLTRPSEQNPIPVAEIIPLDAFMVNETAIRVKDTWKVKGHTFGLWGVERNFSSPFTNVRSLYIVSAKTEKEMELVGYNKWKKYYLPLLFSVDESSVQLLNSL